MGLNVIALRHCLPDGRCSCPSADCKNPGKHPAIKGWRESTIEESLAFLRATPQANLGLATSNKGFRVFVVDVDGPVGEKSLEALQERLGPLPVTVSSRSARLEGGRHLFFVYPSTGEIPRNTASKLGSKIDVRGDGGFVVLPPSRHKSGNYYAWVEGRAPGQMPFADLPPSWIQAACVRRVPRIRSLAETPGLNVETDAVRAALRKVRAEDTRELVRKVLDGESLGESGSRNAELYRALSTMLFVCPDATDQQLLDIVRPSVERMVAEGSHNDMEVAAEIVPRVRAERDVKKAAQRAQDEALARAMLMGRVPQESMKIDESPEAQERRAKIGRPR